jgi:hypothetical protein
MPKTAAPAVSAVKIAQLEKFLSPMTRWSLQCHAASLALVRSGLLPGARVARGWAAGVGGQHSWVVVGHDCYAPGALIVDPTLWSYRGTPPAIWTGTARAGIHVPHNGAGNIWTYGRPPAATGPAVALTPKTTLSSAAGAFLTVLGPLDARGWLALLASPVRGWPAGEIIAAMADTPSLAALVPVDLLGMLTDRNPGGLYLPR